MKALKESQTRSSIEILGEFSHTNDPQSNGQAERAVRSIKDRLRVILLGLERRLKCRVPRTHPIIGHAAEHAADCLNRYHIGKDGKTAIFRIKRKNPRQPIAEFGEKVQFKLIERERKERTEDGTLGKRWDVGIWVGRRWDANEKLSSPSMA